MIAKVLHFTPGIDLGPEANLDSFIQLCRNSNVLDAHKQFEQNVWVAGRQKGHNTLDRIIFSTLEAARIGERQPAMPQPFLDFAKAALVYLQDQRPVVSFGQRLATLRCLEAALRAWGRGSQPTAVNADVLNAAVELARKQLTPTVAYRVAGQLKILSELMRSKGFIVLRQPWEHGLKKPCETNTRISREALAARQRKLPSAAVLRALAGIYHTATETGDVVLSSYCALLLCAPERINEVLRLRRNCLVKGEGEYRGKLGLRWRGSKGFEDTTKWLPTGMATLAQEALAKLLQVSSPAREIAAWYTANPNRLFVHSGAEYLKGKALLTTREIALLLWGNEDMLQQASAWAKTTKKLESVPIDGQRIGYRFSDVEKAVVNMLPATFPYVPGDRSLLCEDSIAITRLNDMSRIKTAYVCMFNCVSYASLDGRFCTSRDSPSVFERFKFAEDDGSRIEFRSHSLRHYLNMLAQTGGLSSAEIAIFSGRKDIGQNRAYDHMTSDEVQAPIKEALRRGFTSELEPMAVSGRKLVNRAEFAGLGLAVAHTTEYGWCAHDFASAPCQMHRDCVNCEEQVCIKGEAHKEANLRQLQLETTHLLEQAREALADAEYGADAWVQHQTKTLERVTALLAILGDSTVIVGSQIRLDLTNAPLVTANDAHAVRFERIGQQRDLK
ncbi:hypothetical protein [Burkholderia multivorans]|uniref:Integrase n=1 Tax=Burkholderia multivorans CGD2 TaxID=513052 RepID=B9BTY9_9BURK|nr:hypothetical protein [Burkholderia multivorans]EEE05907.1 conserved hypothetical protein [Burkholderia multivorans CGD2]EEE12672.1 conserved hypothetical protein [Burkholderia multivorans CGD2M]